MEVMELQACLYVSAVELYRYDFWPKYILIADMLEEKSADNHNRSDIHMH